MLSFSVKDNFFSPSILERRKFPYREGCCVAGYLKNWSLFYSCDGICISPEAVPNDGSEIVALSLPTGGLLDFGSSSTGGGSGLAGNPANPAGQAGSASSSGAGVGTDTGGGFSSIDIGALAIVISLTIAEKEIQKAEVRKARRRARERERQQKVYSATSNFDGIQNTVGGGFPVPLIYGGPIKCGGHIVSTFEEKFNHVTPDTPTQADIGDDATSSKLDVENIPANTFSTLFTRVLVGAGPVESVYDVEIDSNPIKNVKGITYATRKGGSLQLPIKSFDRNVQTQSFGTSVTNSGGSITVETQNEVDSFETTMEFPSGLIEETANGSLKALSVKLRFEYRVKDSGASWVTYREVDVSFKSRTSLDVNIKFPDFDKREVYEMRVTRLSADPTGDEVSACEIKDLREIVYGTRLHPGIAQLAFEYTPLSNVSTLLPQTYTCLVKGLRDIRQYTSLDTFTTGYTDNPAWCCADFLTNAQWGLGKIYDWNDVDLTSFIRWAEYNDEKVNDGRGGLERRNKFAHVFDTNSTARDILASFALSSGVLLFYDGSKWVARVDEDALPELNLNDAMIHGKSLTYSFLKGIETLSKVNAVFRNQDINYVLDIVPHEISTLDEDGERGVTTITMIGVTRPGQAARLALRELNESRLSLRSVEFDGGIETIHLRVGSLFSLASKSAHQLSNGRVVGIQPANDKQIILDDEVQLEDGKTYNLTILHTKDAFTESRQIVSEPGVTNTIETREGNWDRSLEKGAFWWVTEVSQQLETYRVTNITLSENLTRKISAVLHDAGIYDVSSIVNPSPESFRTMPNPLKMATAPSDLQLNERLPENSAGHTRTVIDVDWKAPIDGNLRSFEIYWRKNLDGEMFELAGETSSTRFTISDSVESSTAYTIAVVSVSRGGSKLSIDSSPSNTITTSS